MSKFGLVSEESDDSEATLSERLAQFGPVKARSIADIGAMDEAAAQHGFVSRERLLVPPPASRRRRAVKAEPSRHLAIRISETVYARFVAFADREELTYHDALELLLSRVGS